jgi:REP element-mobilizing transposase RayT
MARLPRFDFPGQPQHVIQRGSNRSVLFVAEEGYRFYLEKLNAACQKYGCDLHAYVLMTNHVHLLMTPQNKGAVGKAMQMLGRYYVQYFNHQYQRTGTLWEVSSYRALFEQRMSERKLAEIRDATNKAWVLGGNRFQEQIERFLQRQAKPKARGGDRRSDKVKKQKTNRV